MVDNKLEYTKFEERLVFAKELLEKKFPSKKDSVELMNKSVEIAIALFVRSEIQYSSRK